MSALTRGGRTSPRAGPGRVAPVLVLAYLGFVSLGLPDSLLGVGWPSMRADLGVPLDAVGLVLAVATAGYLASSVASGFWQARAGVGLLLAASTGLVAVSLASWALAPALAAVAAAALLLGLGSGAVDAGLNTYAAAHVGARHMNWLHASFGLGSATGPLVMTAVLGAGLSWRAGYGVVALAQAALAVAFWRTATRWDTPPGQAPQDPAAGASADAAAPPGVSAAHDDGGTDAGPGAGPPGRHTLAMPRVWAGALLFLVYTGIEVGAGLWAYTLLTEARGVPAGLAGVCVSAYWGSLFVGRVLFGVAGDRWPTRRVLTGCLGVIAAGAALLTVPGSAWPAVAGLVLVGGFAAPVFPLLTLTTAQRVGEGHARRAIGMQVGAAGLGAAALPALTGVLLDRYGAGALGLVLLALTAAALALYLPLTRGWGR